MHVWADLAAVGRLMRPADVIAFADSLTRYANRLREVADELSCSWAAWAGVGGARMVGARRGRALCDKPSAASP